MVSGIRMAARTAFNIFSVSTGVFMSAAPEPVFRIFLTEQPQLMSTISAPEASTIFAASAMIAGSEPKICTDSGFSSGELSSSRIVLGDLWYKP